MKQGKKKKIVSEAEAEDWSEIEDTLLILKENWREKHREKFVKTSDVQRRWSAKKKSLDQGDRTWVMLLFLSYSIISFSSFEINRLVHLLSRQISCSKVDNLPCWIIPSRFRWLNGESIWLRMETREKKAVIVFGWLVVKRIVECLYILSNRSNISCDALYTCRLAMATTKYASLFPVVAPRANLLLHVLVHGAANIPPVRDGVEPKCFVAV